MNKGRSEDGITLVETLVATLLIAIVTTSFYTVMFSATGGSEKSRDITRVSEEARSGLNRLIRDTREADSIASVAGNSYNVKIDFNGDGAHENPNSLGDFEDLTFSYDSATKTIRLNNEVLIAAVERVEGRPIFSYSSNFLEYDWDGDGVTTLAELEDAGAHGVTSIATGTEESYLSGVSFEFQVQSGDSTTEFYGEAQLRNRR
jgi:type II secretory pathway pseudopilin PulG